MLFSLRISLLWPPIGLFWRQGPGSLPERSQSPPSRPPSLRLPRRPSAAGPSALSWPVSSRLTSPKAVLARAFASLMPHLRRCAII
jgi:hypothetical protein